MLESNSPVDQTQLGQMDRRFAVSSSAEARSARLLSQCDQKSVADS